VPRCPTRREIEGVRVARRAVGELDGRLEPPLGEEALQAARRHHRGGDDRGIPAVLVEDLRIELVERIRLNLISTR
jgi:hypothetical protein